MVVLVLLSLAAGVVVAGFDAVSASGRLRSALATVPAIDQLARTEAYVEGRPQRLSFRVGTSRMTMQAPERTEGAWAWSEGRVFHWGRGVTLVAGSSEQQLDGQTGPLGIRIQPDGTSPSYGVVLQAGRWRGVVVIDGILGVARSATSAASDTSLDRLTRSYMPWRVEDGKSYEGGDDDARP